MKTHSAKFLQQRKFYMVLPLLVIPFVTLAFWSLGGGQVPVAIEKEKKAGLNLVLPGAYFDKNVQESDKFALYEQARRDSIKAEEVRRNDPYYFVSALQPHAGSDTVMQPSERLNTTLAGNKKYSSIDQDAELINQRINQLTSRLDRPEQSDPLTKSLGQQPPSIESDMAPDIDRLEKLMTSMSQGSTADPQIQQMDGLLEKILDVQHPQRVTEKIREQSIRNKSHVLPVTSAVYDNPVTIIHEKSNITDSIVLYRNIQAEYYGNAFYGLDTESSSQEKNVNTIDAVVHETQTVVAGSVIKMRLLSPVFIQGEWLAKDQFVYGVCAINGERLTVTIQSIRNEHALYPVALSVYDLDGMEGIYIPGAIARDAAKQATSQSLQDVQLYSMNNSLEAQAAAAGVEAAKGLFSKKAKLIKVTIKAGYQILLKDTNQENE